MHERSYKESEFARVIRHRGTRAFFAAGEWTPHFAVAEKFTDTFSLLKALYRYNLADVELVLVLGETPSGHDIALPLDSCGKGGGSEFRPHWA